MSFLVAFVMSLGLKAPAPAAPVMITVTATPAGFLVESAGKVAMVPSWKADRSVFVVVVPETHLKQLTESL